MVARAPKPPPPVTREDETKCRRNVARLRETAIAQALRRQDRYGEASGPPPKPRPAVQELLGFEVTVFVTIYEPPAPEHVKSAAPPLSVWHASLRFMKGRAMVDRDFDAMGLLLGELTHDDPHVLTQMTSQLEIGRLLYYQTVWFEGATDTLPPGAREELLGGIVKLQRESMGKPLN